MAQTAGDQVLILEPKYAIEFGMPSTHAMLGLMVPLTVYSIIDQRYEVELINLPCTDIECNRH